LIDGEDLRETIDEIGLDFYNGRIEILCDETLRLYDLAAEVDAPVKGASCDIENIAVDALLTPHSAVAFCPVVAVSADTNAVLETSVGVIHRINEWTQFVVHSEHGDPEIFDGECLCCRALWLVRGGLWL
jgi:restriction endonuclease Mrr